MKQLTRAQLRSRENFRMLKIAAETGLNLIQKKRNAKISPKPEQLELLSKDKASNLRPQHTGNLQKVRDSGLYVPPHIEKIAGNRALLFQELEKIQRSLETTEIQSRQVHPRDWQAKRDITDEKVELTREMRLVQRILGLKKI